MLPAFAGLSGNAHVRFLLDCIEVIEMPRGVQILTNIPEYSKIKKYLMTGSMEYMEYLW